MDKETVQVAAQMVQHASNRGAARGRLQALGLMLGAAALGVVVWAANSRPLE